METISPIDMEISNKRNSMVQKIAIDQVEQITKQIKENAPQLLASTGTETVINEIPPAGYYINQPGKYVLGQSINWSPPADGIFFAAIVIQCDNVELDFQGNTLTAVDEGNHTAIGVIVLNSDADNPCNHVYIHSSTPQKNGTIAGMGLCGLWAVNTNALKIANITVEGLTYPDFTDLPSAFFLLGAQSFSIDSCSVQNVSITAMLAGAFLLIASNRGTVSNCTVNTFTNNDGVACGYPYFECSDIATNNCSVTDLTTFFGGNPESTIGHTCIGFMPAKCTNLYFNGCTASKIYGCCDDCHGMSLFPVNGAVINNFTASEVHDGLGPQKTGAKATGLELYGSDIIVTNSQVSNITAIVPQDLQATGFSACGTNILFDSCTATGVTVYNTEKQPDTSHGYGTGFGWAPDPRKEFNHPSKSVTYKDCTANFCQLGFDTWNHQDSCWSNPVTSNCGKVYLIQPVGTIRTFTMNFCSELPPNSPSDTFPIVNNISGNIYPSDWEG